METNPILVRELQCVKYGDPKDALKLVKHELDCSKLNPGDVVVKLLATSINPSDVLLLQGKYGLSLPKVPFVPGNEALFEVLHVGETVKDFVVNDWVFVKGPGGKWRTHMIVPSRNLIKIPKSIGVEAATTLFINPVTAYLMLNEYVAVKEKDSIIINAPTSTVGRALIQLAKARGLYSICILRSKDMTNEIQSLLKRLGATYILDEKDLLDKKKWVDIPKPKLALECVGGKSAGDIASVMADDSVIVVYGCLSGEPSIISAFDTIFRNIQVHGFWLTRWLHDEKNYDRLNDIILQFAALIEKKEFEAPKCESFPMQDFESAIRAASGPLRGRKILMVP